MNTYVYKNYSTNEIVHTVQAQSLLKADEDYKFILGKDPTKQSFIGCHIQFNTEDV